MTIRKVDPQPSAPRPVVVAKPPAAIVPPKPLVAPGVKANINAKTGRTSSFEAFKPAPIAMDNRTLEATSEGRGTNDDSIGRGTNDDSIGRGTNDDSIGSGTGTTRPPDDVGVGSVEEPTARGPALIAGREGLSADITAKMDQLTAAADPERAQQANYIFNTPEFQAMPAEQRAQIVTVMSAGDIRVARGMAEMFEQSGGAMLQAAGKDGTTVLDSLVRMAAKGDGVVGDVMYDLVNPGRIWQGRAPTCTVSSMQYELAQQDPAEYARLMAGLVCDGKVTMRGGGELTCDVPWALQASHAAKDRRSDSEAIFQAAAM